MNRYPNLFAPGKLGKMELKNRIVQGAMEFQLAGFNGEMSDELIEVYEHSAKSGAGLIIPAYASVDDEFSQSFAGCQLKITDRKHTAGYAKLAQRVHKYGAKVVIQVYMAGRQAVPSAITGKRIVAPSPIGFSWHDQIPEEITKEEIHAAVKKFGRAAEILNTAGVDGIEVVAAGGYLINEFMSPSSNKRTDEYGGSFENRARFITEIFEEIKRVSGREFTIGIRYSADEFLDDGYGLDEGVRFAKYFEQIGFDYININNANQEKKYLISEPINIPYGWKNYIIKAVKEAVNVPVLSTNVIKRPEQAEQMLAAGLCDFAVMARMFLADPDWITKVREGREEEIKTCIGCLHCQDTIAKFRRVECAVNPKLVRDSEFPDRGKDLEGKKIVVVGAGPAGMEAAIVCAQRGASVVVFEKKDFIGGSLRLAAMTPDKDPMEWISGYYAAMAKKLGMDVRLNTEATKEQIEAENPYAVFVGAGTNPFLLPFMKVDRQRTFTIEDVLAGRIQWKGEKVVVIGGGMNGCEIAEHCALMGNDVAIVEMMAKLAPDVGKDNLVKVLEKLEENNAQIYLKHKVTGLDEENVYAMNEAGENVAIPADRIIFSLGGRPNRKLYEELKDCFERVVPIGDTVRPGRAFAATRSGFEQGYVLE